MQLTSLSKFTSNYIALSPPLLSPTNEVNEITLPFGESDLINLSFSCPAGCCNRAMGRQPCVCAQDVYLSPERARCLIMNQIEWAARRWFSGKGSVHLIRSDNLYRIKWPRRSRRLRNRCLTSFSTPTLRAAVLCFISGWRRRVCMCERKTKPMSWQHNINEPKLYGTERSGWKK